MKRVVGEGAIGDFAGVAGTISTKRVGLEDGRIQEVGQAGICRFVPVSGRRGSVLSRAVKPHEKN